MDFLTRLFDPAGFPARWRCGTGWSESPWLGWLHVFSDLGVWSAYLAIPIVLGYFLIRRQDLPFRRIFLLFGAFILACGTTHLMEAIIFWWPVYRLSGLIKLFTAIVSWATVFALFRVVPAALTMRSPEELEREISARTRVEQELQRLNIELEQRVQQRTTDLSGAVEALREERELLHTTLGSIGDGVIVTDTSGHVTFLNGVAERLTGWTSSEAMSIPLEQVFRIVNEHTRQPVDNPAMRALQQGVIVGLANHTILMSKDGVERPIDDSAAPIRANVGAIRGAVLVFRDITERKEALTRLHEQEERLRLAIEATGLGIFDYSPETGRQEWSDRCKEIWGLAADAPVPSEVVLESLRAVHNQKSVPMNEDATETDSQGEFFMEHRFHDANGSVRWVLVRGKTLFNGNGSGRHAVRSLGTMLDITDRKQAEEDLRDADHRKDEFLATLAHELRNPLAPIRNSLEVMKRSQGNLEVIELSRSTMERQLGQMVRLVDDLIDVSRISRNRIELRKSKVDLSSIISHAVEASRPLAERSNHELIVSVPSEPIELNADTVRLAQVFGNLLTNACKYTEPGGKIWVTAERQQEEAVVKVKDTGIGIPRDMLVKIFEMFMQVDQTLERSQSGLGIGLTLVKRLVEMHEGWVIAHSAGPGQGSEFEVRLPAQISQRATNSTSDGTVEGATSKPRRILVVDDNRDSAMSLALLLKLTGNQVATAHDGLEAVEKAESDQPDLILLDIGLPKLNGYEACRLIRQQAKGPEIVIVALTGWGQEDDRRKSKEAGFDHHLIKPVDHATLLTLLASSNRS